MEHHTLTELQYSNDTKGPWRLYRYGADGYHSGGQWFNRKIRYPDEEISIADARKLAEAHVTAGGEVRVTDGGDSLVYHSANGKQLYPKEGNFWDAIESKQ